MFLRIILILIVLYLVVRTLKALLRPPRRRLDVDGEPPRAAENRRKPRPGRKFQGPSRRMNRSLVSTARAPQAIGPYSQAVRFSGSLVFTSGQIPIDPATGQIVGATTAEQTEQVLRNLSAVLEAVGRVA